MKIKAVSQEQEKLLKKIDNAGLYAISLAHCIFAVFVVALLIFMIGQAGLDISMFKRLGITQIWMWILLLSYGHLNLKLGKKIRSGITKNTDAYLKWLLITAAIAFIFPFLGLSGLVIIFNLAILEVAWRGRRALKELSMDRSFNDLIQKDPAPLTVAFLKKYAAYTVLIFLVVLGLELTFVRLHNQASVDPVQQSNRVTEPAIDQTVTPNPQSTGRYDYLVPR